jgi:TolB-like protein/class 3 adenylate cyclase
VAEQRAQRQLSAILAADVAGYSRLIGLDEEGTLTRLKELRRALIDPQISEHRGRIVKTMGDGLLVQFASAVDAMRCAVELQSQLVKHNAGVGYDRRIEFRIGINVGDVIIDGDDLHGDGVNIAARLQALAQPGGICVSGSVHDQLQGKLDFVFTNAGEQQLKNINHTVRVWQWTLGPQAGAPLSPLGGLHEKISILILPFTNLSGDTGQEYFADGLTEDFITELSRYKGLHVSARHTSFHYKEKPPKIKDLRHELGVGYVLEGSVRRVGNRIRITAQLIETLGGEHVWAERYDRDQSDLFGMQDELIGSLAATLEGRMVFAGASVAQRKPTTKWTAYDYFLKGRELGNAQKEDEARSYFANAIQIDPNFAHAHAWLATCSVATYWLELHPTLLQEARQSAERALSLDNSDASAHHAMAMVCLYERQLDRAGKHFNRATSLNPHDVSIAGDRAQWLRFSGKFEEALSVVDAAINRDAFPPVWLLGVRGASFFHMRRYREAIDDLTSMQNRRYYNVVYAVAALAQNSDVEGAIREANILKSMRPSSTISSLTSWYPFADTTPRELLCEGLRKAGLPE